MYPWNEGAIGIITVLCEPPIIPWWGSAWKKWCLEWLEEEEGMTAVCLNNQEWRLQSQTKAI